MTYAATALRLLAACMIAAATPLAAAATVDVPTGDPAMAAAFRKAAAGLDGFLAAMRSPPAGAVGFTVKVGFVATSSAPGFAIVAPGAAHSGYVEYFWLGELRQTAQGLEGVIDNEAEHVDALAPGQRVTFSKAEVADWMYMQNDKIVGNATACPALAHASEQERRIMRDRYGLACD